MTTIKVDPPHIMVTINSWSTGQSAFQKNSKKKEEERLENF